MNEALMLAGDLIAGVLLGAFFFGGLWWTIQMRSHRNGPVSCSPEVFYSEWPSPSPGSTSCLMATGGSWWLAWPASYLRALP